MRDKNIPSRYWHAKKVSLDFTPRLRPALPVEISGRRRG